MMAATAPTAPQTPPVATTWEKAPFDVVLLCTVLALAMLSIVMVYSSSAHLATLEHQDPAFYLKRQALYVLVGIAGMAGVMRVGYRELERWAYPLLIICAVLVAATFLPGIGLKVGGARRWLRFPGFQLQPSEFAKIALCIYLARSVAQKGEALKDFKIGLVPHALVFGVFAAMVLAQPDFGSTVVMFSMMLLVLFVAGARLTYVFIAFAGVLPIVYELIIHSAYRMRRIEAFLDPFRDRFGASYQVAQALMSVGSGGFFGLGLGEGREKLGFLPAGHTDYILASIGEELGLVGIALTLGLYALLIWRGLRAALRASDPFGTYLAFGITSLFAIETVINAGMCLALLPSKGLALPLLSFGGTSIVKAMLAAGLLLSVSGGSGGYLSSSFGAKRCT